MTLVAKSDHSTGNSKYCSYVLQSNDLVFAFTAPYSRRCAAEATSSCEPLPDFDQQQAFEFVCTHGFAARAIGKYPRAHVTQVVCENRNAFKGQSVALDHFTQHDDDSVMCMEFCCCPRCHLAALADLTTCLVTSLSSIVRCAVRRLAGRGCCSGL